jgi:hypothetical protein
MRLERSYDFQTCSTFAETKRPDFLGQAANSTSVVSTVAVISLPSHSFASSCPHFTIYRATVKTFFFVRSKLVGVWLLSRVFRYNLNMLKLYHTGFPMYRLAFLAVFCMLAGLLSGCKPAPVPPTATNVPTVRPTPVVIFATRAPPPTSTVTPTPAVAEDIRRLEGNWILTLDYQLAGYWYYSNIHYTGSLNLTVNDDGSFDGSGDIYTNIAQPPCNAVVAAGSNLTVSVSGQISAGHSVGDTPIAVLVISPADPTGTQTFQALCRDTTLNDKRTVALLWPSLAAINQLQVQFPFKRGRVLTDSRNLTAPSGGEIPGTLTTEIRIG